MSVCNGMFGWTCFLFNADRPISSQVDGRQLITQNTRIVRQEDGDVTTTHITRTIVVETNDDEDVSMDTIQEILLNSEKLTLFKTAS